MKLVISDLDGTITGADEKLPPGAAEFIRWLKARGVLFTIASGRSERYLQRYIAPLGISCPYIATNGAVFAEQDRVLFRRQFPIFPLYPALKLAERLGMAVLYTFSGEERVEYRHDWLRLEEEKGNGIYRPHPLSKEEWEQKRADKILIVDPMQTGRMQAVESSLKKQAADIAYVNYRDKAIEMTAGGVNKAAGIAMLLEKMQISPRGILTIGDDKNDIEMFQSGGRSAAVSNAAEEAKQAAEFVCTRPGFEGVKEAVCRFID